jgi:hypothetical protein
MSSAINSISPLRPIQAWQSPGPNQEMAPAKGDVLRMTVSQHPEGGLLAVSEHGPMMMVPAGTVTVGDVLLLRVLATHPKLELQMLERRPSDNGAGDQIGKASRSEETAALRTDQAWLQQRFHGPGMNALPATLAAQWRSRVLAEVLQANQREASQTVAIAHALETVPMAIHSAAFHLLGWNSQTLLLRLLSPQTTHGTHTPHDEDASSEESQSARHDDPDAPLRLGITFSLDGERVQILLQWQHGLLLHLSAEQPKTLQALRSLLPSIAGALAAVPLPLRHCQLSQKMPESAAAALTFQMPFLVHSSSAALFRAAAEVVGVLQKSASGRTDL